ncbi:calcium-binding protein [Endozoicomonas sp. ALB091]|uniref:calcium-binding protein n=1 Tax=Endozoicomonas sp. ALB091 TaxID=3403073 RepID=UPI003BB4E229
MSDSSNNPNDDLREVFRDSKGKRERALETLYDVMQDDESFSPENKEGAGETIDGLLNILFRGLVPEGLGDKMVDDVSKLHNKSKDEIDRILGESAPRETTNTPPPAKPKAPGPTPASPLVLDLDGDGIETVGQSSGIYFDHDGDGFKERSGFVGADDGLLIYDRNGDGKVNDGTELFGNSTVLNDGSKADNGFTALAEFDSNGDGLINANDEEFVNLRVFRDLNQNGITDDGELITLEEAGVKSLSINYTDQAFTDSAGNEHRQVGNYTADNGQVLSMNDVWFDTDPTDTIETIVEVPLEISLFLPDARGFGTTFSLHQAMARDESGELKRLVEQFVNTDSRQESQALLEPIIFAWTGQSGGYRQHGRAPMDTRKIGALESFYGYQLPIAQGGGWQYARMYNEIFASLVDSVFYQMASDSYLKPLFDEVSWTEEAGSDVWLGDFTNVIDDLYRYSEAAPSSAPDLLQDFVQAVRGINVYDARNLDNLRTALYRFNQLEEVNNFSVETAALVTQIVNSSFSYGDRLLAGNSDIFLLYTDVIEGDDSDNELIGLETNDQLEGMNGNDVLDGRAGNDLLIGGNGNDEYRFGLGYGEDRINNYDRTEGRYDVIRMLGDLTINDITTQREGDDLVISINGTNDTLRVLSHFSQEGSDYKYVDAILFSDGSKLEVGPDNFDLQNVASQIFSDGDDDIHGTSYVDELDGFAGDDYISGKKGNDLLSGNDGHDRLFGGDGNDQLLGGSGHDELYGGTGDDSLTGGTGDDLMVGGLGSDTYYYGLGDGLDVINESGSNETLDRIILGAGIRSENILIRAQGADLVLYINGDQDEIRIRNFYNSTNSYPIDKVEFSDPDSSLKEWTSTDLYTLALQATDENDELQGDNQNNIIDGLKGDDLLLGGAGNDNLSGSEGNDTLRGEDGNDTLIGGVGADTLEGGRGNDRLEGGAGNDLLLGGAGSDTYVITADGSQDIVEDYDNTGTDLDKILFDSTINPENVSYRRTATDLIIEINKDDVISKVIIRNGFISERNQIDQLVYADGTVTSMSEALAQAAQWTGTDGVEKVYGYAGVDIINALGGNDVIYGRDGDDQLSGGEADDRIYGELGNDNLVGDDGADYLHGGIGDDSLNGGRANDQLHGDKGNDSYIFAQGDGHDTITEYSSGTDTDVIQLSESILPANTILLRQTDDLLIKIDGDAQSIRVRNYFNNDATSGYAVDRIEFADGTVWDIDTVKAKVIVPTEGNDDIWGYNSSDDNLSGLAGNDVIRGLGGNDIINTGVGDDTAYGGDGNDTIDAGAGADIVEGGAGNDLLTGGSDNDRLTGGQGYDTYLFSHGHGQDTIHNYDSEEGRVDRIRFDSSITTSDVRVTRQNDDLVLITSPNDSIRVERYFQADASSNYVLQEIEFADGTVWDIEQVKLKALTGNDGADTLRGYASDDQLSGLGGNDELRGGDGNDLLDGSSGDDVLEGGKGQDTLNGGTGSDRYLFSRGDSQDLIYDDFADSTTLILSDLDGGKADFSNVVFRRVNSDLQLTFKDSSGDQITLKSFFSDDQPKSGLTIEKPDGTSEVLDANAVALKTLVGTVSDDVIQANSIDNVINSLDGNDRIDAYAGNDTLNSGAGDDVIYAGEGDDSLTGGLGNDQLYGGDGDDQYLFSAGHGNDQIDDTSGNDELRFTDVNPDSVLLRRDGTDLLITNTSTNHAIRIRNQFATAAGVVSANAVDRMVFADGTVWDHDIIKEMALKGTSGDDTIYAHPDNDSVDGLEGNDVIYGREGNDTLSGSGGNDQLYGEAGNDLLDGGLGDDTLIGGTGADTLQGQDGQDNLQGEEGDDILRGGNHNDQLLGGAGQDRLYGDAGNDSLDGGSGDDELHGGDGNDVLNGGYGSDQLYGGAGDDSLTGTGHLIGGTGNDTLEGRGFLVGGDGDDHLTGWGSDTLHGGDGNDTLIAFNDPFSTLATSFNAGKGNDTLYGSFGNDSYVFNLGDGHDLLIERRQDESYSNIDPSSDTILFGQGIVDNDLSFERHGDNLLIKHSNGTDSITVQNWFREPTNHFKINQLRFFDETSLTDADVENRVVTFGTDGDDAQLLGYRNLNDEIHAGAGNDKVWGRAGDDQLYGGAGDDYLDGEDGNDRLFGGSGVDNIHGKAGDDHLEGGLGNDSLSGGSGADAVYGQEGADSLFGGAGDDLLDGGTENDYIDAGDGNDTLLGGDGADQLRGEGGNDVLRGGAGDDKYVWSLGDGADTIDNSGGGVDILLLGGGATQDRLSFERDGDDLLIKANGDDAQSIRVIKHFLGGDYALDAVQPDGGTLISTTQINQLVAGGSDPDFDSVVSGTEAGEQLAGSNNKDKILGKGGNDVIFGMAGNDRLEGGDGNDQLVGGNGGGVGTGDDVLLGGLGNDILRGEDGNDTLDGGAGDDHYYYNAGDGVDVIDATGGGTDWILFNGNIDRNRLSFHQDGNDLVILLDNDLGQQVRVKEHFLGGEKAISYVQPSDGGYAIPASSFAGLLTDLPSPDNGGGDTGGGSNPDPDDGSGQTPDNGETPVAETGGDDSITGTAANDILLGGAGNDTLTGGAGNDQYVGGTGDDTYVYTSGQDVIDSTGGGTDILRFSGGIGFSDVSSGLIKSGDDLILRVAGGPNQVTLKNFFLGGEHLVETMTFDTGGQITSDQIFGAFGLPVPNPSADFDNTVEGTAGDDASLAGTAESDLIKGFNGDDQLLGNAGNDRLEGSNGADTLNGGAGNDLLIGGRGNDTYVINTGGGQDVIVNAGGGSDTLHFDGIDFNQVSSGLMRSGNDFILRISGGTDQVTFKDWFLGGDNVVDTITFASGGQLSAAQIFGAFGASNPEPAGSPDYQNLPDERSFGTILSGSAGDQVILGSSDADWLDGGAGNDQLYGNAGSDYLMGGDGNDTYHFAANGGSDTINNLSNTPADTDVLQLSGIEEENLWFTREGDNLLIDVIGSDDQITVQDWYSNDAQKLDQIRTSDAVLLANKMDNLVNAMAGFDAPPPGNAQLPDDTRTQVNPVIAANWQAV